MAPNLSDEGTRIMASFSLAGAADVAVQQDAGTVVVLHDQTGEVLTYTDTDGKTVEVTALVAGSLSNTYRRAEDAQRDRAIKRRSTQLTGEMLVRQQMELTASCVLSWTLRDGDKPIPCTKENVLTVFTAAPWIRTEIEAAMSDAARFLR